MNLRSMPLRFRNELWRSRELRRAARHLVDRSRSVTAESVGLLRHVKDNQARRAFSGRGRDNRGPFTGGDPRR